MIDLDVSDHTLDRLFDQLGLASDEQAIEQFVAQHRPLAQTVDLADASFWNESQSQFIREAIQQDADWALVVGKLDALLRHTE